MKHSIITILRNTKGADKDNKDHRMSSYHEFLNNKGTQTKFMIKKNKKIKKREREIKSNETLSKLGSWQKVSVY